MQTTRLFAFAVLVSAALLFSCKSKTSETASATKDQAEVTTETPKGKYALKSGIVEYKTQMMGMDVKQVLTFDDYGKEEVTEVMMEMMGTKIHTVNLTKDGFIYTLDMVKKTGTKSPVYQGGGSSNIDFENMTEAMIKDMNLKKEGSEEFLGKTCEKMSVDYKKMNMKGNYLVYKGVALKMDTDMGTIKMKMTADKFVENPVIPSGKFEIPADVKITENK